VALLGDEVQQPRLRHLFHVGQGGDEGVEVVAVDGADVVEAELFEQVLGMTMPFMCSSQRPTSWRRLGIPARALFAAFAHAGVDAPGEQFGQVAADGAHRGADGHFVVVEDDEQVGSSGPPWLSASKAMPAPSAPSPMTAMTWRCSPRALAAMAMPSAALMEVLEWPTPKVS
jgi:hypothetical protein